MSNPNSTPTEVFLGSDVYNTASIVAERHFGKQIDSLSFEEASHIVGALLVSSGPESKGVIKSNGNVVVDSAEDGSEAFNNASRTIANELAPKIDDERTLIINLIKKPSLWEFIRGRQPKVIASHTYHDEPPQYA